MSDSTPEQRIEWMQRSLREIGNLCLQLADDGRPNGGTSSVLGVSQSAAAAAKAIPLTQFLAEVVDLTLADRLQVVDAAIAMLSEVYVHLPLKRAQHGIDPVQRLRLLRQKVASQSSGADAPESARAFHGEMIEIFHSLRDLHTNYILPASYQGVTAFLPFLVQECFEGNPATRKYVVVRVTPSFTHPTFKPGVTVLNWNGVPIDRAVEVNAAREAGSNPDARHARGLEALTLRPMYLTAPPDEAWVLVEYEANGKAYDQRFDWQVTVARDPIGAAAANLGEARDEDWAYVLGFDAQAMATQRARKSLFFPDAVDEEARMAKVMEAIVPRSTSAAETLGRRQRERFSDLASAERAISQAASAVRPHVEAAGALGQQVVRGASPGTASMMPQFFTFGGLSGPQGSVGYVRIFSFMAEDANAFVGEFIRILKLLPQNGLLIDVRGNGGGNINAGELLLQLLTKTPISPEPFHFINSESTIALCKGVSWLSQWTESVELGWQINETFSQGFPLTPENAANSNPSYRYPGPVVLLIDALCYSTTDIFTAGFQDHKVGKILGTSSRTGAGGANVWDYGYLGLLPEFKPLPKGVSFRSAIRRSTRVRDRAGIPLEDLGVKADAVHQMTRRDILGGNVDLFAQAAQMLRGS